MKVLVIAPSAVGDAVIASGVLGHLGRQSPARRITVASTPGAAGLFAAMPNLDRVIPVRKRRLGLHWLALWRRVAFTRWDLVVDFKGSGLPYLVRARRRAVWPGRGPEPMVQTCAAMLGIAPPPPPVVWSSALDRARAAALLPGDRPVVALCPTAAWAPKTWAPERFAALFAGLAEGPLRGAVAAVFCGPGEAERAMARPLLALLPGAIDLGGRLTLGEAAAAIGRCALFVGNDSGLTHLAAATGTATVGLCGTTIERATAMTPVGRAATWALASGPSMAELSVERAFVACRDVLGRAATFDGAASRVGSAPAPRRVPVLAPSRAPVTTAFAKDHGVADRLATALLFARYAIGLDVTAPPGPKAACRP